MSELKIKVTWDGMAIELEGETESVKEIFNSLKESGMGRMGECNRKPIIPTTESTEVQRSDVDRDNSEEIELEEVPSLSNVVLAGGPRTESEWMLIYAFYCSEQGTKLFTKDDLRQSYKDTNRSTPTRRKNFASNLKILTSDRLISAVNQNDFRIEKKGIELATKIVRGEIAEKGGKGGKKKSSKSKSNTTETYSLVELNLSQDERNAFGEFYATHVPTNNQDKTVVIAKWLKEIKGIEEVDKDIIFTSLRTLGESTSFDIGKALHNAKNLKSYYVLTDAGKFKITHIGEDYVVRDMMGKGN